MDSQRARFDPAACSVAAALRVVGDKWTMLVMREAFYGLRRYDQILEVLGCARNILSDRLAKLVEHGLLGRVPYREGGQRERFEYRLTPMGLELFPVVIALMQWGDRWIAQPGQPSVLVAHRGCDELVQAELRCVAGHGPLTAHDTAPRPGPRRPARPARTSRGAPSEAAARGRTTRPR
jgi:DNA-binding HxlR family transcriptional regulator